MNAVKISVVTATYNASRDLPGLLASLRAQSDQDFEWVVADGLSTDGTAALLRAVDDLNLVMLENEDFGIYDALNRAIRAASGDYYIVAGADDVLDPEAIARYRAGAAAGHDFVTARVRYKGACLQPRAAPSWLVGAWRFVSCHTVGCMIRKRLHERHGYYSKLFPVAADQLFIKRACQAGASVRYLDFVAGEFGSQGLSSVNLLAHITDTFKVQYLTERHQWLQLGLFALRLAKNKAQSRI
jgi:glycosyltransferase involved in cell wall biosynthesis